MPPALRGAFLTHVFSGSLRTKNLQIKPQATMVVVRILVNSITKEIYTATKMAAVTINP